MMGLARQTVAPFARHIPYGWRPVLWRLAGRPLPAPDAVKHRILREHAEAHDLRILIETGTYRGATVAASLAYFERIYSIELSEELYAAACQRFAGERNVVLLQGDSAERMVGVLDELSEPALFWLDAHWSAGMTARGSQNTPVAAELAAVLDHPTRKHVILIDDARHFTGENDYPTLEQLEAVVAQRAPHLEMGVDADIIRLTPAG